MSNTVVRPLVPEDYPAVKEIVTESFGADLPEDVRQPFFQALKRYEEEPWYDPEHLLVAEVDGEVVSQMGVRTGRLSLGGAASVPAALVGTVCTRASHRGQGIGSEMMRSAFGWMARFGPAVSYLHTSTERHGFYGRLGYRKAIMSCPPDGRPSPHGAVRGVPAGSRCNRRGPGAHRFDLHGALRPSQRRLVSNRPVLLTRRKVCTTHWNTGEKSSVAAKRSVCVLRADVSQMLSTPPWWR